MCHSPAFSPMPIQGQDFWQQLLNSKRNSRATSRPSDPALCYQAKAIRPFARRASRFSIPGPCVCFPSAAPRLLLAGFPSETSSSPSLPKLPPWLQVKAWMRGPQAQICPQGQVPSPGASPGSLPVPAVSFSAYLGS